MADFGRNPHGVEFGEYGLCYVRYGKANKGSAPKRRSVLTVWSWAPEVLEEWISEFPGTAGPAGQPGVVALRTGERVGLQRINSRFAAYRDALGLDGGLDFHSLRRSYVTHLIEDGWDARFVQEQASALLLQAAAQRDNLQTATNPRARWLFPVAEPTSR